MSNAYIREENGQLTQIELLCMTDEPGRVNLGRNYNPVALTPAGTTTLMGWGGDNGEADVYATEGGREIIVPQRIRERVRQQLATN